MKRVLLLVSSLWMVGSILYAQNSGTTNGSPVINANQDGGGNESAQAEQSSRNRWAEVTVTPGAQGLPTVNSYIAPWPLGTMLQDSFSQGFQAPGITANSGSSPAAGQGVGNQTQSTTQAHPATQTQTRPMTQTQPANQTQSTTQARPASSQAAPSSQQGAKQVVVPSPVHYDRAGRRVIEPGWQDTLAQIVRSEREAALNDGAGNAAANADGNGTGAEPGGDAQPAARETVIVVPGPTKWRIRGTLTVAKGMLALDGNDGVLWYLPGLDRYIGFIDGLDAGEEAILEGYAPAAGSSQERYFQPTKLIIDDMGYDLSIPPYGLVVQPYLTNPEGQTLIREVERPLATEAATKTAATKAATVDAAVSETAAPQSFEARASRNEAGRDGAGRDSRNEASQNGAGQESRDRGNASPWTRNPPAPQPPAWQHNHKSPWSPPASVFEFEMDYESFWQDDPAKRERREQDSREIWY